MAESIVDSYAHLLTKDDAFSLFQKLIDAHGSREQASQACGLERKTTYNWSKTEEMKVETKKKILSAFFDLFTEDAFDFITEKSVENSVDIIYLLLSSIYGQVVIDDASHEEISSLLTKFDEVKIKYEGVIRQYLEEEIGDMEASLLVNKPGDIAFKLTPPNLVRISDLSELLPSIIKEVYIRPPNVSGDKLAENWNISEQFINSISTGLQMIEHVYKTTVTEQPKLTIDATPILSAGTASLYSQKDLFGQFKIHSESDYSMVRINV